MMHRAIAPISLDGITPTFANRAEPIFEWVEPATLLVDDAYQRNLADRSMKLIRRIVSAWDWTRFKPPVAVMTDAGLELIDGQHTAIAAASHPDVAKIPVMIVEAAKRADRAAAFLGHNRDRLNVTAPQMHVAAVAAGERQAVAVAQICEAVGVEILRTQPKTFLPRQTMAVAAIRALVEKYPQKTAVRVLVILANAAVAPIRAEHIKAVEHLLADPQFRDGIDDAKLTAVIKGMGTADAEREARTFAATHRVPVWKAYASVWFRDRNKRFAVADVSATQSPLASSQSPARAPVQEFSAKAPHAGASARPQSLLDKAHATAEAQAKKDMRPAHAAWASGVHIRRCSCCDEKFSGHPTATQCADCAYSEDAA